MSSSDPCSFPLRQKAKSVRARRIETREWWLWGFAVTTTLALTAGMVFLAFGGQHAEFTPPYWTDPRDWVRALAAFVLLFDIYTLYQHLQFQRVRRQLAEHSAKHYTPLLSLTGLQLDPRRAIQSSSESGNDPELLWVSLVVGDSAVAAAQL